MLSGVFLHLLLAFSKGHDDPLHPASFPTFILCLQSRMPMACHDTDPFHDFVSSDIFG